MVAVTYGVATPAVAESKSVGTSKGLLTMIFEVIVASQMIRAEREVARYRHLLPRKNKDEPFVGR